MKIKYMLLSVSCLMALPLIQAQADPIPLVNGDFSANGTAKVFFWDSTGAQTSLIPGWTPTGPGAAINYDLGGAYVGNSGVQTSGNYGGAEHLFLDSYDPAVYQTTAYTIASGDQYTLDINVSGEWAADGNHNTTLSLYYLDGSTRVVFASDSFNTPNAWAWTPEVLTGTAPGAGVGDLIGISIQNSTPEGLPTSNADSYTAYGSVVLSSVAVPEPASIALFGLGGLALLAFRRRA